MNWINIKLDPNLATADALKKIQAVFSDVLPAVPFDYRFADQQYAAKFVAEERIGKLSGVFTALAIFISCLGLFGLASYLAERRSKEIGVRKVLGASVRSIWQLVAKDFVFLITISCAVAIPLVYFFMDSWLQNYEYRTVLHWWIFVLAAAGALVLTLLTVSFQALKAAYINPTKSLRSE